MKRFAALAMLAWFCIAATSTAVAANGPVTLQSPYLPRTR